MAPGIFSDRLHFSLYTIVDMEFFDKKPDIIRAIVSQPDILLFTTMHGIAKIVDRYGDALRCRLALIEDGCYKIYQPKVASEAIKRKPAECGDVLSSSARRISVLAPIFAGHL